MSESLGDRGSPFARRIVGTFGTSLAIALIGFATGVIAARLLGPEGRGSLAAIQIWGAFAASLALLGLPEALTYYSARTKGDSGAYAATAVAVAFPSAFVLALLLWVAMPSLLASQSPSVVESARLFLLFVLAAPLPLPVAALRGIGRFAMWNAFRLAQTAVWLCVIVGFAWMDWSDPHGIAVVRVAALLPLFIGAAAVTMSVLSRPRRAELDKARRLLRFGIPNVVADVPSAVNLRIDQLVIAAMLPSEQLGLYVVAVAWSIAARPLTSAYGQSFMPRIAEEDDPSTRIRLFGSIMRTGTVLVVSTGLLHLVVTRAAIPLVFGAAFVDAIDPALVLVLAGTVWSYGATLRDGVRGLGYPSAILWSELAGVPVSVALLLLLIGPFGLVGVAFASLCGYTTSALVLVILSGRFTGLPLVSIVVPRRQDLAEIFRQLRGLLNPGGVG